MKLLNTIILFTSLLFVISCSDEEEEINPPSDNVISSIDDLSGTWNLIGINSELWSWSIEEEVCYTQSNIIISDDGTGNFVSQFFVYNDGDCTFSNIVGQVSFINASTLAWDAPNSSCSTHIINVNSTATQIQKPICIVNDSGDSYFDGYLIYELQN